jgi:hypothetical protein
MRQTSAMLGVTASVLFLVGAVFVGTPAGPAPTVVAAKPVGHQHGGAARGWNRTPRICATPELKAADVELIERFVDAEYRKIRRPPAVFGPIQVAFHCVYYDDSFFSIGLLTQTEVQAQIDAMNFAFAGTGISFNLASTSFTNNPTWFLHTPGGADERNMKLALGADTREFLNIYSTGLSFVGLLGYASFPWNLRGSPELDGVVISYDSLPGGFAPFDEGDTLVHEVGHWCGLFHTFQGGCSKRNDGVADTPAELDPFFGCAFVQPDTCPAPGLDPIFNFMDYSDDACLDEFTAGQTERMTKMLTIFRSALQ